MSREIRRVPANWQHPTYRTERRGRGIIETWQPLFDHDFAKEAADWDEQFAAWQRGERPEGAEKYAVISFDDWHGERPDPARYVPYDVNGDLPWWQMYETVSEGTPVTPAFATAEELIAHLSSVGETHEDGQPEGAWPRERAEQFVMKEGWFPSFIVMVDEDGWGKLHGAKDGFPA